MRGSLIQWPALFATLVAFAPPTVAQQATITTPYQSVGDSFYESTNLRWGLSGPGWFFRFGGGPGGAPYGNFDPNAGAGLGVGFGHGGVNGYFYGNMSQGSRRSLVSQSPSLTLSNGMPGYLGDASLSPFVISTVPVVGGFPAVGVVGPAPLPPMPAYSGVHVEPRREEDEPLEEMARPEPTESTAARAVPSVEEARRLREKDERQREEEVAGYLERARHAETTGKLNVARQYYLMADRRATGAIKDEIHARLAALPATAKKSE